MTFKNKKEAKKKKMPLVSGEFYFKGRKCCETVHPILSDFKHPTQNIAAAKMWFVRMLIRMLYV